MTTTLDPVATIDLPTPTEAPDRPAKLIALVAGLITIVCAMLFAFAAPSLNSGAHNLSLAVSGPSAATGQLVAGLEQKSPGTFDVTTYATAAEGAEAITNREAIGGIAVGAGGITIQTAAGAGTLYKAALTAIGTQLQAAGSRSPIRS
ncbi:MAG: hypothetical protein V9G19_01510 [Tetrasphaera sp.]